MTRKPEISQADLKPGIRLCFAQARYLLESALDLIGTNKVNAAANLFVLAVQEIGKAKLLREALETGQPQPKIVEFRDHEMKTEKGIILLGSSGAWLKRGAFQGGAFQADAFDVGIPADEPTRLDLLYVNYGSGRWLDPPLLSASEVRRIIEEVIEQLPKVENTLLK